VFLVALVAYGVSPNVTNSDSYLTFPTAVSILHTGDLTLDEFDSPLVIGHHGYLERNGKHVDFYPWPVAMLFVPVVAVVDLAGTVGIGDGSTAAVESDSMGMYQLAVAGTVSAVAAGLVTLMAIGRSRLSFRRRNLVGLAIGLTFALGTSSWSTASRALWQHGPSMALLAGALVVAVRATKYPTAIAFIALGAIVGVAYTVRPTNAVVVVAFGVWCVARGARALAAYAIGGALVALPWMLVNRWSFGDVIPPYHAGGRIALHDRYGEALVANLVSPARGLFVFAPVALVAVAGAVVAWRARFFDSLHAFALAIAIGYVLVVSAGSEAWWAGHSIGPRFLTDPLPMLAVLAVPAVDVMVDEGGERAPSAWRRAAVVAGALSVTWSVMVNGGAAVMRSTNCWNIVPTDVNDDPERVWSIDHPQFIVGYLTTIEDGPRTAVLGNCADELRSMRR
jgi:hypothetical protein